MDTLQLKLFISLSQTLNFTKTANEFYVTQPTVSNYIKALESNLGVTLLKRNSHSVSLTPEGKEFVSYAKQLLSLQAEAENRLRNISEGRRGYIKVAMLSSAAGYFTVCLEEFLKRYPGVQVNVDLLEGAEMTAALGQNNYDIYFAHQHMVPENEIVEYRSLGSNHLHLFINKAFLDSIDMNNWSSLAKYHFVSTPAQDFTLSGQINKICANRGIVPDIINYYNRADMAVLAINSGVGISILPPHLKYFYNCPNVVTLPIDGDDAKITMVVAWQRNTGNPDVQRFLSLNSLSENIYFNLYE
ncbi:MAG: LysR family transcriptional regulator [Ruminococcaceae bacterium]|nr:LysR family transcriptional regulator [Oscillospiraceae bacterium]